jgi:hypothetical protein
MSALLLKADICSALAHVRFGPCVDGSGLARTFFTLQHIGRCGHVFGVRGRSAIATNEIMALVVLIVVVLILVWYLLPICRIP